MIVGSWKPILSYLIFLIFKFMGLGDEDDVKMTKMRKQNDEEMREKISWWWLTLR